MPSTEIAVQQQQQSHHMTLLCPDCHGSSIVQDFSTGDLLCADCNTPVGDRLVDSRSEWRRRRAQKTDDSNSDSSATGSPLARAANGVGLLRAKKSRNAKTRAVEQRHEETLERGLEQISAMCLAMDVPRSIESASCEYYRRVESGGLHRGKNQDAITATCVFLACRQQAVPRTFKELCALTRVPRKDIGRMFKYLKDKLGAADTAAMSSDDLMTRYCANLSLLETAQECAILLGRMARERDTLAGKSPVSVAGACIYMASHLVAQPRDARVISHVAGVSEVTIKNSYKLLYADRALLLSSQILAVDPAASIANLPIP
ncbi:transcription initiation factor IIB [Coemansia sp. S2]|nr:transcription initiation factor IIB [Coemansia sp. S2]KAJ2066958.1 transcription initiation factor IIB [Coemansia sp. S155-1]KAJ2343914.1 transcription initiation factor IIB [Coemansia sp. RSA 2673]